MGGQRGSWVVVTTRSWETTRIIGNGPRHGLQGLSTENSWCLFKKVAFGSQHSNPPEDLVLIGQDIVERCADVPLAIKVVGSLLYGQEKQKWLSIRKLGLAQVRGSQNSIMPILKLSYYQLESSIKSCFSYCAIFPKDFVMEKKTLTNLWIAQGYIPLDDHQCMEDVAEEYFSILLRRCFFQDIEKDEDGDVISCKMHDLMHDVAQEVVGKEICTVKTMNGDFDRKVRHLSLIKNESIHFSLMNKNNIRSRSYLHVGQWYQRVYMDRLYVDAFLSCWKYLRALDLSGTNIFLLPDSIGGLLHLRYLDLSNNFYLGVLPEPITKLYNLQTLNLRECANLKELPKDLSRLVKLRVLNLHGCRKLSYMPRGLGKLTQLHTLTMFMMGEMSNRMELFDGLEDLKPLRNLKGFLIVRIGFTEKGTNAYKKSGGREGGYLGNKDLLRHVRIYFSNEEGEGREEYDEAVMGKLQPHSNLRKLAVCRYHGVKIPWWPLENDLATFLPNLVAMELRNCPNLQYLGQLQLPLLKKIYVNLCRNLTANLQCPALEELYLFGFNRSLEIIPMGRIACKELENEKEKLLGNATPTNVPSSSSHVIGPKLRRVEIDNVAWLNSLSMDPFQGAVELVINGDGEAESLGEAREFFCRCSSSLQFLRISNSSLKSVVSGGLEHLTALEALAISYCPILSLAEDVKREDGISMPWQPFHHSLRLLELESLWELVDLPNWIQYLTTLQILKINSCQGLESLPNWMSKLTSLRELLLVQCSARLIERCQQFTGEDWPQIQHIPSIKIS